MSSSSSSRPNAGTEGEFAPGLSGRDLRLEVAAVGRRWARSQYRLLHLLVQLDESGDWALDGARTCAHWVGRVLDIEVSTAREWLRIGRLLGKLHLIDAALQTGRVSYSKVRQLTRIATVENEAELLDIALRTTAGRLAVELARWTSRNDDPDERKRRQRAARSMTIRVEPDGMIVWTVRLPPEVAAVPMAAIDSWIVRRPDAGCEPVTDSDEDASADASEPRSVGGSSEGGSSEGGSRDRGRAGGRSRGWASIAQQRVDGLVMLMSKGGAIVDTEVVLHVRADGCTLDDGTPIAGSMVERVAPESFIRLLIHDAEGRPINASGRHRHPSTRQKRVVHERDQGCVDCRSTAFLQFDHEPDFEISKRTLVDELKERCWICHRARHEHEKRPPGSKPASSR